MAEFKVLANIQRKNVQKNDQIDGETDRRKHIYMDA